MKFTLHFCSSQRTGHVRVLSFKIAIAVLCQGPLEEKYRCEYNRLRERKNGRYHGSMTKGGLSCHEVNVARKWNQFGSFVRFISCPFLESPHSNKEISRVSYFPRHFSLPKITVLIVTSMTFLSRYVSFDRRPATEGDGKETGFAPARLHTDPKVMQELRLIWKKKSFKMNLVRVTENSALM